MIKDLSGTFIGNSAQDNGGAIYNVGTITITAHNGNTVFTDNSAQDYGGAIYNSSTINMSAKNGNKIIFSAAKGTAQNDIWNEKILNLNEGRIEILSAISSSSGTTNVGTADSWADVIVNKIEQKEVNVNNGSLTVLSGTVNISTVTVGQSSSLDIGGLTANINDLTVNGTLKMSISGISKDSDVFDSKVTVNNLTLGNASRLSLNVASGQMRRKNDSTGWLDLIDISGTSSGEFSSILSNNRYTVTYNDDQTSANYGKYKITYTAAPTDIIMEYGGNMNNIGAAEAWDRVPATGFLTTDGMQAHLNELSQHNGPAYVKAANNIAPSNSQVISRTAADISKLVGNQIDRRQDMQGMSGGDGIKNLGIWGEALVNYSKQDRTASTSGFTGKTAGFTIGADAEYDENTILGVSYTYNYTDVDSDARNMDVDGHTFSVYGKYQPAKWYVRGMGQYGLTKYDETAYVGGWRNSADYDVRHFALSAYTGYDLPYGVTPEFGLRYMFISQEKYTDAVGQQIRPEDDDLLTGVLGVKYSKTFTDYAGIILAPKARAAVTYDIISNKNIANVNISNFIYEVRGERLNRFGMEAGIGLEADVKNWSFSVGYDLGVRKDYVSHSGMFRVKYRF